jgi:hypothetical protein
MGLKVPKFLGVILFGFGLSANFSKAQQMPEFEVLSNRVVESVSSPFGGTWRTTDPSKYQGVVLLLKISFTPEIKEIVTSDFTLTYKSKTDIQKAVCMAVTIPPSTLPPASEEEGIWITNDLPKGEAFSLAVGNMKCCTLYSRFFFAPLPNDVNEVTLLYKDKMVAKTIGIKRGK